MHKVAELSVISSVNNAKEFDSVQDQLFAVDDLLRSAVKFASLDASRGTGIRPAITVHRTIGPTEIISTGLSVYKVKFTDLFHGTG